MDQGEIRLGVIGCGGFGLFALQQFAQVPGVTLVGMAGTHRPAAHAAAQRFGIPDIEDVGKMLARDDIDLVYIATPPFLHHPQAMAALQAGKHVICEKPLAMTVAQADEMIAEARRRDRLLVANLMQRYNPVFDAVGRLVEAQGAGRGAPRLLRELRLRREPRARPLVLGPVQERRHLRRARRPLLRPVRRLARPGRVEAAQRGLRPGSPPIEEHVQCTVRYGRRRLVNFYHGFHQAGRMDRQELRLVFERGDVTLYDWVPTRVRIHAVVDEAQTRALCDLFPGARLDVTAAYGPKDRACEGRHKALDVYQMIELSWGEGTDKSHRYGELLRALLADQLAWIRDHSHPRTITEENGRDSLAVACEADRLAQRAWTCRSAR